MTRQEKGALIDDLVEKLKTVPHFYITDTAGMTVAQVNNFREMCYKKGLEYKVVKNTLIKKALEQLDTDYSSFDEILKGSSGIMFSPEVANVPARLIKEYKKKNGKDLEKPAFKAASLDADLYVGPQHLEPLSNLKSKDELLGEIITLLQSPATNVISALHSGKHKLAGIVKTLSEREG